MFCRLLLLFAFINLVSCYKNHFYVSVESIDRNFLASSHIKSPDPRQDDPPIGERLLVSWQFPKSIFEKDLDLLVIIRFWDDTQKIFHQPILKKRGFTTFFFPKEKDKDTRILTYRVQAISKQGEIVGHWDHQFWTKLIRVGN